MSLNSHVEVAVAGSTTELPHLLQLLFKKIIR
jgi:hypothetical protein